MLSDHLLDECLARLQHPAVRDLAWTLLAAPLLETLPCAQRHPLAGSRWARQPGLLADWLLQQEQHPGALLDWLARARSQRLGIHYEQLWQFALQQAPGVQLLAANLPVRAGARTLGELDLLLRDADGVHHLELAIKLYLGPAGGDGRLYSSWRGAGRADNLQRKLRHLSRQQLPLAASPQARQLLAEHAVSTVHSALWMSGYLFYPWPDGCAPPAGSHAGHARGHWLRHSDWPGFCQHARAQHWQPVPRECRLAPLSLQEEQRWPGRQLQDWLDALASSAPPMLLAGFAQDTDGRWYERTRVMLLNNQWPAGHDG
ncbi:DUF1853 family protein [Pseudomonas sp. N040]|uniref:DUF1853 family protein n=1 Tax=Pseudomonas sp. N040 TaxID=2785325 RepID=UPI001E51C21F|nr:DUF1853 family protein [Pseudomonas sp. N040]